ncbi:hypothetical protein [Bordetella genomosp. 4]|uniref:Uncharacterized protein n=1 Tax=Bordetella genomosp. 4 TaxID=463044 RepID=A0A261U8U7_9BORD|nr:hypothetical protein [Bordetella genomosp. 4]OZI57680.1 hypothetical protein CAL20_09910 [Bordetella genomosp. 4]
MHDDKQAERQSWRFDKTINIPMLIGLVTSLVYLTSYITRVDNTAQGAMEIAKRVDATQVAQAQAVSREIAGLRSDNRADLRDLNSKVDQVLFRLGDQPKGLSEWTKK